MPLADIEEFWNNSIVKTYSPRSAIIFEGEQSHCLYYLLDGSVTIAIEDENGKEIIIAYRHKGAFFGETELFDQSVARETWVHAKTECKVAEISYDDFHRIAKKHPELLSLVGEQMAESLRKTTHKIGTLAFYDVAGRVINSLLDLCAEPSAMTHPGGMQIKVSRQEISKIVGCSREKVGLVLKELEAQSLIEAHGQNIVVFGKR